MIDDREYHLIKQNKFASILRSIDIAWFILIIILFFVKKRIGLMDNYLIGLSILIISFYSLVFLYSKQISFTIPHTKKGQPQFFKYYTQYNKFPLTEIVVWIIAIFFSFGIMLLL